MAFPQLRSPRVNNTLAYEPPPPADTSLAASLSATGTCAAAITTAITLAASLSAAGTAQAALTTNISLAASAAAVGTVSPALTTDIRLATSVSGAGTLLADLTVSNPNIAAALAGAGAVQAALSTDIRLAAGLAAAGTLTPALTAASSEPPPDLTYEDWLERPAAERVLLADLELSERLQHGFAEGSGAYSIPFTTHTHVQTFRELLLALEPEAYWPLTDPSGTRATDLSHHHAATYNGGPTLDQRGPLQEWSRMVRFDGANDYLALPATIPATNTTFTLVAWLTPDSTQTDADGAILINGGVNEGLFYRKATKKLLFSYFNGVFYIDTESGTVLTDGVPVMIALVINGASLTGGTFYVNGVADGTINTIGFSTTTFDRIGARDATTNRLKGSLGQVAFFRRALSIEEIRDLYTRRAFTPTALSLYRQVTGVRENGVALTQKASISEVKANAGTWYYDAAAAQMYVHATGGGAIDAVALLEAFFLVRLATAPKTFAGVPPYDAQIGGGAPSMEQRQPDPIQGITSFPRGDLVVANAGGFWDAPAARWIFTNRKVTFRAGGDTLEFSEYATVGVMDIARPPAPGNTTAVFQLRARMNVTDRAFPQHTIPYGAVKPYETTTGQYYPMWWGRVKDVPLLWTGNGVSDGLLFYGIDPTQSTSSAGLRIDAIRVYNKSTGELIEEGDPSHVFVVGDEIRVDDLAFPALVATIGLAPPSGFHANVTATYWALAPNEYEFRADMTRVDNDLGTGAPTLQTFGAIARDILERCGVPTAEIDTAAFAAADAAAPQTLSLYVPGGAANQAAAEAPAAAGALTFVSLFTTGTDLLNRLERSCFGSVFRNDAGLWTCKIWDPSSDVLNLVRLDETDVLDCEPVDQATRELASEVVVRYALEAGTGAAQTASRSSTKAAAELDGAHSLQHESCLVETLDAEILAGRILLLTSRAPQQFRIQAPPRLVGFEPQDRVRLRRSRGPSRSGALDAVLEAEELVKHLNDLRVDAVFGNQRGLGEQVRRPAPDVGPLTWDAATDDERRAYAFALDDATERADPGDPDTYQHSIAW